MKNVRKNLREFSRQFEEQDQAKKSSADKAVIEARRQMLAEWLAYRERSTRDLAEEREDMGLDTISDERKALDVEGEGGKVVEEIFEEILEESEEVIQ